jgi:hypothetical protein
LEDRHELVREDICVACWEKTNSAPVAESRRLISSWQGVYHAPPAVPQEAIQKENAETLLRKLIEANDPKHGPACFILAVMLERKRLLKVKEQIRRQGARVFVYEHAKTGDLFTITDPNLQLNQLQEVQRDVGDLLANGFHPVPLATQTSLPLAEDSEADDEIDASADISTTPSQILPVATPPPPTADKASGSDASQFVRSESQLADQPGPTPSLPESEPIEKAEPADATPSSAVANSAS